MSAKCKQCKAVKHAIGFRHEGRFYHTGCTTGLSFNPSISQRVYIKLHRGLCGYCRIGEDVLLDDIKPALRNKELKERQVRLENFLKDFDYEKEAWKARRKYKTLAAKNRKTDPEAVQTRLRFC